MQSTGGARVRRSVLASGVRILSEDVPGSRSATIGMWVAVGSRDEQPGDLGSTHFLEHLLFKGTPSRTALDIAVSFDAVGGEHNAVTAKEYTCYYAKVQDRDLGMAVDVLADMVTSSLIDAEEFETERGSSSRSSPWRTTTRGTSSASASSRPCWGITRSAVP
ncbi:Protease 3 precursor [Clavibacter michiganensis subsp. michiganensis]|uniref:Protease 3 n=1 Tax=Clavibacter michiganensis subsp. michiganensis TaxID=33013 RepID=A0A251XH83_CLAMM|nr:Protease 3 precursor [Clavibacter michiganensis subsp. michiganensis]OUE02369.1 Protease 3 precursor [Clavibacter michiganensis subsp. michiganensis]